MSDKFPMQTEGPVMTDLIGLSESERQPDHLGFIAFLVSKGLKRIGKGFWVFGNIFAHIQTRADANESMRGSALSEEEINNFFGQSNVVCDFFDEFHKFEAIQHDTQKINLNRTINWENLICRLSASDTLSYTDDKNFWDFLRQEMESKTVQKQDPEKNQK